MQAMGTVRVVKRKVRFETDAIPIFASSPRQGGVFMQIFAHIRKKNFSENCPIFQKVWYDIE